MISYQTNKFKWFIILILSATITISPFLLGKFKGIGSFLIVIYGLYVWGIIRDFTSPYYADNHDFLLIIFTCILNSLIYSFITISIFMLLKKTNKAFYISLFLWSILYIVFLLVLPFPDSP